MRKKLKAKLEAIKNIRHWIFEVKGTYSPGGDSNFEGKVKDDTGRTILTIVENEDYNQLTRLLRTSKYMQKLEDMKGLAEYIWDRNLIPISEEEKEEWKKKKHLPIDIRLVRIV